MSTEAPDRQQQKVREFMSLFPLTVALAGLPEGEAGRPFTEGQLDSRATSLRAAYKAARQLIMEVSK